MKPEILSETPITSLEVKEFLTKLKNNLGELNFRAQKTLEHLEKSVSLSKKQAEELKNALEKLKIPRFKEQHINKIIDLLPVNLAQVTTLLQAYPISVKQDNMKKIAEVVNKVISN